MGPSYYNFFSFVQQVVAATWSFWKQTPSVHIEHSGDIELME